MFETYTEAAIKVLMAGQKIAYEFEQLFVGTEHVLLALCGYEDTVAYDAILRQGLYFERVYDYIEDYVNLNTIQIYDHPIEVPFTPRARYLMEDAVYESVRLEQPYVSTEHILLAILNEEDSSCQYIFMDFDINIDSLRAATLQLAEEEFSLEYGGQRLRMSRSERILLERERFGSATPTIDYYSDNLSYQALTGELDPIVGRDKELNEVIRVLARRRKNNPVLVGEPGVGKTAVAEGLAQIIVREEGPEFLDGFLIMALDLGGILAGTKYRGDFEERLKYIVEELEEQENIILVIDEIHTLIGAGAAEGAVDAANILKPSLARGGFKCIGATTVEEYRKYIQRDAALERRFQPINVDEPDIETTIRILTTVTKKLEQHHGLQYTSLAIDKAVEYSDKYIQDRYLPDKAIDILDDAGALVRMRLRKVPKAVKLLLDELADVRANYTIAMNSHNFDDVKELIEYEQEINVLLDILQNKHSKNDDTDETDDESADNNPFDLPYDDFEDTIVDEDTEEMDKISNKYTEELIVDEDAVAEIISYTTGVPVSKVDKTESLELLEMEDVLKKRIIGQPIAVNAIANAIRRARVGLRNQTKPIASFIFAGPTGVGKTEVSKALAEYMFDTESSLVRFDMSEYMEKQAVAKLIGSPPGYVGYNEGGQLTEAIKQKPYCVLLLDEVEKAHPDVYNILLQILDDGRLTDSQGKVIDFRNAIIIMTTNLGSQAIAEENLDKLSKLYIPTSLNGHGSYRWKPEPEEKNTPEFNKVVKERVKDALKSFFRPEFLNRLDDIIVFNHLSQLDLWEISTLMVRDLKFRLSNQLNALLILDPAIRGLLMTKGWDPSYGARPMRRAVTNILEDQISEKCLDMILFPRMTIRIRRLFKPRIEWETVDHSSGETVYSDEIFIHEEYSYVPLQKLLDDKSGNFKVKDAIEQRLILKQGKPTSLSGQLNEHTDDIDKSLNRELKKISKKFKK